MKPFDPTKPYCRRDGKPVKIIYELPTTWVVITETYDGVEMLLVAYKPHGRALPPGNDEDNNYDLVNIPEKIEGWQNVYKGAGDVYSLGKVHSTHEEALKVANANSNIVACIKVSFTEGEGLSDD